MLSIQERRQVAEDIVYLNLAELRGICRAHGIPWRIAVERPDGSVTRTRDADRKGVVIDRILHFLATGEVKPETLFPKEVVAAGARERPPGPADLVLYGDYRNGDPGIRRLLKKMTGGRFGFGAVAQEVLRACWSAGDAPSYERFARLWLAAADAHTGPNPEWAYLSDLAAGRADPDWKAQRRRKSQRVLALLDAVSRHEQTRSR